MSEHKPNTGTPDDQIVPAIVDRLRQELPRFGPGVRVRYLYGGFTGTILRSFHGRAGGWIVLWDRDHERKVNPAQAAEANLEVVDDGGAA